MPVATSPTDFPQTLQGRPLAELAQEIASYVGGETTGDGIFRAKESIRAAVRRYNEVAWRCRRTEQDIALVASLAPHTYTLEAEFRSPVRALLIDSDGKPQGSLCWVNPEEWRARYPSDQATGGNRPEWYTAENPHLSGEVTFQPWPQGTLRYPTVRLQYSTWINPPRADSDVINVPMSIEQGIADMALAIHLQKSQGWQAAAGPLSDAYNRMVRLWADPIHGRDYGEIEE